MCTFPQNLQESTWSSAYIPTCLTPLSFNWASRYLSNFISQFSSALWLNLHAHLSHLLPPSPSLYHSFSMSVLLAFRYGSSAFPLRPFLTSRGLVCLALLSPCFRTGFDKLFPLSLQSVLFGILIPVHMCLPLEAIPINCGLPCYLQHVLRCRVTQLCLIND